MRKLYIFDMGGVVVQNADVLPDIAAYLGISIEEGRTWGRELFITLMEGKLTTQEFWAIFSQRSGLVIEEELFGKFFHPVLNEPVYSLILELKKSNRVVCGTNTLKEHYILHLERGDYRVFEAVYASHRIGFTKPKPEFYHHILEQENFPPSRTVFIDDTLENVEAAQRLGIRSFHFMDYERLTEQLTVTM
jgi:HAD superfamily hydrolase (TIGR01509 family)